MASKDSPTSLFPISVEFTQGEQPSGAKFQGWAAQTEAGLNKISTIVGDVWSENFPSVNLFVHTERPSTIANLARLIGPASMLNPLRQGRQELTETLDASTIPAGVNEFSLVDDCGCSPPLDWSGTFPAGTLSVNSSIETALGNISGSVFSSRKNSKDAVTSSGDYYVDLNGRVFTFDKTGSYSGTETYTTKMYPDTYDGATMNVIPDFNQTTPLCNATSETGYFKVQLPTLTKYQHRDSLGNLLEPGDVGAPPNDGSGVQALVPRVLSDTTGMNLSAGDAIPEGFMYLWDDTNKEIVSGASFLYDTTSSVRVTGATLEETNTRYRLITVGNTITEHLAWLTRRFDVHDHSGREHGFAINHADLSKMHIDASTVSSEWSLTVSSPPSTISGNDHPQYLSRYGWVSSLDAGQYDNAMLGHLFMAADYSDFTANNYNTSAHSSKRIYFGHQYTFIYKDASNNLIFDAMNLFVNEGDTDAKITFGDDGPVFGYDSTSTTFYLTQSSSLASSRLEAGTVIATDETSPFSGTPTNKNYAMMNADTTDGGKLLLYKSNGSYIKSYFNLDNPIVYFRENTSAVTAELYLSSSSFKISASHKIVLNIGNISNLTITDSSSYTKITGSEGLYLQAGDASSIVISAPVGITLDAGGGSSLVLASGGQVSFTGSGVLDCDSFSMINIPQHYGAPSGPQNGSMYYDTDTNKLRIYVNTLWKTITWT